MQAPSSTPPNTTDTAASTAPAADPETLDVVWIGESQDVEQRLLGIAPHVRVSVSHAVSAVESMLSGTALPDVVVIDTTTPGIDTRGILARMKAADTDLPVVLLTTTGSGRLVSDASQLATCDVVVKIQGFEQQLPAAFSQVRARHDLTAMFRESRQSQDRLRTVLEFQPAVMCVVGPDGVISALNQAGLSLLGTDQQQVVGRSFASFLPAEERDDLLDLARRACSGEPRALDHSVLKADASRVNVRTRAVPFETSHGGVALVTIHERSGPTSEELASLTGQRDALDVALGEAKAQLDEIQANRDREAARADALASELARSSAALNESVAALNHERERSGNLVAEMATATSMLEQMAGQDDVQATALREANAQLDEIRAERARESWRADALASELAGSVAARNESVNALNESLAALNAERERSGDLLVELTTTRSTLEQSSRLQALLESDHQSLQELRDQLRRFAADAERLCSGMIERQQGSLARLEDVADPTF